MIPEPPKPKTAIEPVADKADFEISWPNVIRIDHVYRPHLSLDWQRVEPLELNAGQTARIAELAPIVKGKPDVTKIEAIDLEQLAREFRTQRIIFETARDVYDQMQKDWGAAGRSCWPNWCGWSSSSSARTESASRPPCSFATISSAASSSRSI